MKRISLFIFLAVLFLRQPEIVAAGQGAGLPGAYLNYAGGARVNGMGRSYVGLANDSDALVWNPAGLALLRPNVFSLLHTNTVEDATLDYLSYVQPLYHFGGIGFAFIRLDSGDLSVTDQFNVETGEFSNVEQTLLAGYGMNLVPGIAMGATINYSQQRIAGVSASGFGLDMGFLVQLPRDFSIGMRLQNIVPPKLKFETGTDQFPRVLTVGLAARMFDDRFALTWDIEKALDVPQSMQVRFGAEGTFFEVAKLRAGLDVQNREFTIGLGYLWGRSAVDYSFSNQQTGFSRMMGASYSFGGYGVTLRPSPKVFSPMGLKKKTSLLIRVNHTRPIHEWVVQIKNQDGNIVFTIRGSGIPPKELTWDGKTSYGMVVAAGVYRVVLTVTDKYGKTETTPTQVLKVEYGTPLDTLELQTR